MSPPQPRSRFLERGGRHRRRLARGGFGLGCYGASIAAQVGPFRERIACMDSPAAAVYYPTKDIREGNADAKSAVEVASRGGYVLCRLRGFAAVNV